jgi:4-amino-4-deoxy-L-arabinose transferase-like glycosyltransferase
MRQRQILFVLLAAAVAPFFVGLGDSSIWDANEAFYVETPRAMLESGDFVSPTFNDAPRFNKPVLSYWIVAGFYALFGVSVGVERLAIACGGVGLIVATFFLARAVFGRDAAPWAALALASSPRFLMFSRRIFIDVYIALFVGLALLFFVLAERRPGRRRLFLSLMYVSIGLGVLTKGPVALVLPGLAFAAYLAVHRQPGRLREMMLPAGALIVAAVVVPWYAAVYARHGWDYIWSFIVGENIGRYTATYGVQDRGLFFYPPVVLGDMAPWSIFLIAAALSARRTDGGGRLASLLWIWIFAIVAFFSFSRSKQDLYILPIVPAVAALAGGVLASAFRTDEAGNPVARSPSRTLVRWTTAVVGLLLVVVGIVVAYVFVGPATVYALRGAGSVAWLAMAGGAVVLALAAGGRVFGAAFALGATAVAANWIFVLVSLPSFEPYKPVPEIAEVLRRRAAPDAVIAEYDVALPSLTYYLRRPYQPVFEPDALERVFATDREVYCILAARDYEALKPRLGQNCVLARYPLFNVKLGAVLARQPLPELLLVTNTCTP